MSPTLAIICCHLRPAWCWDSDLASPRESRLGSLVTTAGVIARGSRTGMAGACFIIAALTIRTAIRSTIAAISEATTAACSNMKVAASREGFILRWREAALVVRKVGAVLPEDQEPHEAQRQGLRLDRHPAVVLRAVLPEDQEPHEV